MGNLVRYDTIYKNQFTTKSSQYIEEYPKSLRLLPNIKVVHTPKSLKRT